MYLCHLLMMIRYAVVYHHHHQQQQHEKQQRQQQQRQQQWKDDNAYGKYAASSEVTLHTAEPTSLPLSVRRRSIIVDFGRSHFSLFLGQISLF